MGANFILPFSPVDINTNLLTQSEYTADGDRVSGNKPGTARSKLNNKALRQATIMVAGLGQFIALRQALDVTDDLTVAAVAAMLAQATGNRFARFTANGSFTVPDGVTLIWVSGCGGGGGGGGNPNILSNSIRSGAGGGGAGRFALHVPIAVTPLSTHVVSIGAGGLGGTPSVPGGLNGGTTSLGTLLSLPGGTGGGTGTQAATSSASTAGGTPGPGYPSGGVGQDASYPGASASGGLGGTGPFGGAGSPGRGADATAAVTSMIPGSPAEGFGVGGGGAGGVYTTAVSPFGGTGATGGFGGAGFLMIEW